MLCLINEFHYNIGLYFTYRMGYRREHKAWARNFFLCECLNFVNVIVQIFLTDRFLGYEFSTFGMEVTWYFKIDIYQCYLYYVRFKVTKLLDQFEYIL